MGDSHLTYEHFNTLLIQVEAILNSRPISPLSNDPNDLDPLTPGHFIIGDKLTALSEENVEHLPMNNIDKFQQIQRMTQSFWRRWHNDYLHTLQQRTKWMTDGHKTLQVGQLVLIKEDSVTPLRWKLGRIVRTCAGKDNVVRVVDVQTSAGIVIRSFSKICGLPVDSSMNEGAASVIKEL